MSQHRDEEDRAIWQQIANRIRQIRAERCVSLEALTPIVRITRAQLNMIELGRHRTDLVKLAKIAGALGETLESLLAPIALPKVEPLPPGKWIHRLSTKTPEQLQADLERLEIKAARVRKQLEVSAASVKADAKEGRR